VLIGSKTGEHMVVDTVCGDAIWQSESCRKVIGRLSESYRKVIGKLSESYRKVCGDAIRFVAMPQGLWRIWLPSRFLSAFTICQVLSAFLNFSQLFSTQVGFYRVLSGFTFCQVLSGFVRFCQVLSSFGEPGLSLVHGELFPVFHLWVVRSTAHLEGASGCLIDH